MVLQVSGFYFGQYHVSWMDASLLIGMLLDLCFYALNFFSLINVRLCDLREFYINSNSVINFHGCKTIH